ncbi:hypothetical protein AAC387_Pa07g1518 [Persea americana]
MECGLGEHGGSIYCRGKGLGGLEEKEFEKPHDMNSGCFSLWNPEAPARAEAALGGVVDMPVQADLGSLERMGLSMDDEQARSSGPECQLKQTLAQPLLEKGL